jgi:hypothetical protein
MRTTILAPIAALIAALWLAGPAAANVSGIPLNKGKLGQSSAAAKAPVTTVTRPSVPFNPGAVGVTPIQPRPLPDRTGQLPFDPGRIATGPNLPTNPPVANPQPPFQPPTDIGLVGPCQRHPGLCTVRVPTNPPGNANPAPPVGGNTPPTNPPGGNAPGGGNGGGTGAGNGGGHDHAHHHHHHFPYFGFGLAAGLAAAPTVVEYVAQPVYQPVYAAPAEAAASHAAPATANAPADPFDQFLARLNGLNGAMQLGLITRDEYRSQRVAVLASLDAGQVDRAIGIQQGLRQLKTLAENGVLTAKEYDEKRKQFVLFL